MALTAAHRTQAYALLTGDAGADAAHTIDRGRFVRAHRPLEELEQAACERAVQVVIGPPSPVGGYNNPLDGRDLSTYPVTVRIAYARTDAGDAYDASGAQSGPGSVEAIEDRAHADLKALRDVLGWQPNWTGLDPVVIDCAPSDASPAPAVGGDRAIYEQSFDLITRAGLHTAYAPSLP